MAERFKRKEFSNLIVLVPIAAFVALVFIVLSFARGRAIPKSSFETPLLAKPQANTTVEQNGEYYLFCGESDESATIIAFDGASSDSVKRAAAVSNSLDTLRLDYRFVDISASDVDWDNCETLFLCFPDLDRFSTPQFHAFITWLETGDFFWCAGFETSDRFRILYRLLGITSCKADDYVVCQSFIFEDDILPGLEGVQLFNEDMSDTFLPISLQEECEVHIIDADTGVPILWTFRGEKNIATVFNSSMFYERNIMNGLLNHAVAKHRDITVWPIINSLLIYIDDFPAPQPEGFDERLKEQFGYNTQSFFMNVWWPDMKKVANRYGLLYTGVFVETYNDNMEPPFEKGVAGSLLRYYSSELISEGGEIALHGYNHQSLIPEGFPNTDGYAGWPSQQNMYLACCDLVDYVHDLLPEVSFSSYVPPSNYLSKEGYDALTSAVPKLRVISGLYYDYEDGTSYNGNFQENPDGIIDVPRISSGYSPSQFDVLRLYSSLFDLGVFSHFIHPDDVLDIERGALLGWTQLYADFGDLLDNVVNSYPQIRTMTATAGGGAVQRAQRVVPAFAKTKVDDASSMVSIDLDGFIDVAWLGVCLGEEIVSVEGGEAFRIGDDYWWVRADQPQVRLIVREV